MTENRNRLDYTIGDEVVTNPDWLEEVTAAKHIGPGAPGYQLIEFKAVIQVSNAQFLQMTKGESK